MTMQSALHDYWSVWKQFVLQGVMQEDVLPPALMQSWHRCVSLGLDPYAEKGTKDASDQVPATVSQSILSLVRPAMEDLYQFAEGSECVIIFADDDLRIIDMVGNRTVREELEHLGLRIGSCWSEEQLGANALALALQESFPIQLEGAMHYLAALHTLYTSAAPIHDLLGQAVGILAAIGHHEHAHPHTLSMITAAAQAISNQLQMQVWLGNANDLLSELKTILQTLPEGILLLRRDGMVSQIDVQQPLDRPVRLEETASPSTAIVPKNGVLKEQSVNAEVQAIISALHASDGHAAHAAALLGISRTTLWRKMVKYGLIEDRYKG